MSELDHEIRQGLRRLSDPTERTEPLTFDRLAARRRQRRIRNTVLVMLPIVAMLGLVGGLISFGSDDGTTVTADGDRDRLSPPAGSPTVSVERTEVVGGDGGTARVVMDFDGPLPGRNIRYVDDITSLDARNEIVYTTQDGASVHVCESVHSFPPPAEGTVDLLIPADWFAQGEGTHTSPPETIADPAKFVVCGPHNGFFQYSIWGPVSADVADVNVTVEPDGRRLIVQIDSAESTTTELPKIDQDDADAAESVVSAFLDDLQSGDLAAAAERWTGYPELGPGAPPAEKTPFIEELRADPALTRILEANTEVFVTASWGWTTATPVVTVLAPRDGDDPPVAVAFLTGFSQEQGDPDAMWIQRLPQPDDSTKPDVAGSFAEPGQQIEIPGVPLEGGARAYINSREIAVDVDHVNLTMTITLPGDVEGDVAVTLSTATPELPGAHAFALTIGSP